MGLLVVVRASRLGRRESARKSLVRDQIEEQEGKGDDDDWGKGGLHLATFRLLLTNMHHQRYAGLCLRGLLVRAPAGGFCALGPTPVASPLALTCPAPPLLQGSKASKGEEEVRKPKRFGLSVDANQARPYL